MSAHDNNNLYQRWSKKAQAELKNQDLTSLRKKSLENINIEPVYFSDQPNNFAQEIPGEYPFTRGARATMYTNRPWTIRQYAGFSSAQESNKFYQDCLKKGQKGLSVAFDLPTHRGYDSDNPSVSGDVGKAGVAIDSVLDMQILFNQIDLSKVSVSMTMNGAVLPILGAFIVTALEQGIDKNNIRGTIQNDILKEFMVRNTFIYPPESSMRIVGDIIEYCAHNLPNFNSISISGYHIHEAGADLGLELGLTLADGLEYVQNAQKRGLNIDDFAPRLSFFFATGMNFFMEIAKLRAARTLWAQLMKSQGANNPKSLLLRTHCQTSGWSLAAQDPYNNIIRTTIEALAAILGGTQSLHTNSFDEALALPTPTSARIARNTQLILQHETKICDVIDPLGGSYYLENLTNNLVKKAQEYIKIISQHGGMTKALIDGLPIRWIEQAALKRQALIDSQEEIIVGVNKYKLDQEDKINTHFVDSKKVIKEQKKLLNKLKQERDQKQVDQALQDLISGARNNKNLLELAVRAMKARATVGEVSQALEQVFQRYEPIVSTSTGIYTTVHGNPGDIKNILNKVKQFALKHKRQPRILVAKLGQDGHDRGAKIIASAFSDFGFDVDLSPLFQTPTNIANQAIENDVHVIGVSTLAAGHRELVPDLLKILKKEQAQDILVVVGGVIPPSDNKFLQEAGVAEIFGPGTNIIEAALKILKKIDQSYEK